MLHFCQVRESGGRIEDTGAQVKKTMSYFIVDELQTKEHTATRVIEQGTVKECNRRVTGI